MLPITGIPVLIAIVALILLAAWLNRPEPPDDDDDWRHA